MSPSRLRSLPRDARTLRALAVVVALGLAAAYFAAPDELGSRLDRTFLGLLAAAAIFAPVQWERLTSLSAGQFEFKIDRPEVVHAVEGLSLPQVADERLRSLLARLESQLQQIQGSRVLWIDDKPHDIVGERRLFRALGLEVATVSSSEEAAEELERDNDFDVVVSDVQRRGDSFEHVPPDVPTRARHDVVDKRSQVHGRGEGGRHRGGRDPRRSELRRRVASLTSGRRHPAAAGRLLRLVSHG